VYDFLSYFRGACLRGAREEPEAERASQAPGPRRRRDGRSARADCAVVMLGVSFSFEHFMLRTFVKRLIAVTVLSKESMRLRLARPRSADQRACDTHILTLPHG